LIMLAAPIVVLLATPALLLTPSAPMVPARAAARFDRALVMQEEPKKGPPEFVNTPLSDAQTTVLNIALGLALTVPLISAAFSPDGLSHKLFDDVSEIPVVGSTLGSLEGKFKGPPGLNEARKVKEAREGDAPLKGALKGWSVKERFGSE